MLDRAKERPGQDGFHSVPLWLGGIGDGVESVLTVRWQAQIPSVCAGLNEKSEPPHVGCYSSTGPNFMMIGERGERRYGTGEAL